MCEKITPRQWWATRKQMMAFNKEDGEQTCAGREFWALQGMKNEYNTKGIAYSLFTPVELSDDRLCPVLFVMHMGGDDIYSAEWYGFLEQAAKRGYIVAMPAWRDGPEKELESDWKESGLTREGFVFYWVLEQLRKKNLPMDESRIYVVGMSGGGNAAAFAAQAFPDLIAAVSPSTGAALQGSGVAKGGRTIEDPMERMGRLGMGTIMLCGLEDDEFRWPITDKLVEMGPANLLSVEQRLEHLNRWLKACGAETGTSLEDMERNISSRNRGATSLFGLNFDREYQKELEVPYYFGDCFNQTGDTVARFVGVSQCGHHFSEAWAEIVCDFFDTCRRDPVTKRLIVGNKVCTNEN